MDPTGALVSVGALSVVPHGSLGSIAQFRNPDPYPFVPHPRPGDRGPLLGRGTHKLPVKADVRKATGKEAGDAVTVRLEDRLSE